MGLWLSATFHKNGGDKSLNESQIPFVRIAAIKSLSFGAPDSSEEERNSGRRGTASPRRQWARPPYMGFGDEEEGKTTLGDGEEAGRPLATVSARRGLAEPLQLPR